MGTLLNYAQLACARWRLYSTRFRIGSHKNWAIFQPNSQSTRLTFTVYIRIPWCENSFARVEVADIGGSLLWLVLSWRTKAVLQSTGSLDSKWVFLKRLFQIEIYNLNLVWRLSWRAQMVPEIWFYFCMEHLQFLVYFTIEKSHMYSKEKIISLKVFEQEKFMYLEREVCFTLSKNHHLSSSGQPFIAFSKNSLCIGWPCKINWWLPCFWSNIT